MARSSLSIQQIALAGLAPAVGAGNIDGHSFVNDGRAFLLVRNTNVATRTVTVPTPALAGGLAVADVAVVVPALTGDLLMGPFDPTLFNQAGGVAYVDLSAVTGVTIAAIRL